MCKSRTGIPITLNATSRGWFKARMADGNAAKKHVWRARIVATSADGVRHPALRFQLVWCRLYLFVDATN